MEGHCRVSPPRRTSVSKICIVGSTLTSGRYCVARSWTSLASSPQPHHQASSCSASQRLPFGVLRMLGDLQDRLRRLSELSDMVSGLASCRTGVSKDRKPDRHSQYLTRASFCSTATEVKHRSTPEVPSDRNSQKPSGVDLAYRAIQLTRGMRSCRLISSTGCELAPGASAKPLLCLSLPALRYPDRTEGSLKEMSNPVWNVCRQGKLPL